jgi:hypothetical protein
MVHLLLLRAAGRIPDRELAELRALLAAGEPAACAVRLNGAFPQSAEEIAVLAAFLPAGIPLPEPADAMVDTPPATPFIAFPPADLPHYGTAGPLVVDETDGGVVDDLDDALLGTLDLERTAGVWRCWRITAGAGDTASATRVYLVEADLPDDELPGVADRGHRALAAAGHAAPVEVYRPGLPLPAYQWTARSQAALIWAPTPPGEVRMAADGPDELPLEPDEIALVVTYLRSAPALVDGLYTDGGWIWPASVADRLVEDGTLTDAGLLAHLREDDREPRRDVGAVAVHRALAALVRLGGVPR